MFDRLHFVITSREYVCRLLKPPRFLEETVKKWVTETLLSAISSINSEVGVPCTARLAESNCRNASISSGNAPSISSRRLSPSFEVSMKDEEKWLVADT